MWPHTDKIPSNSFLAKVFTTNGTNIYRDCYCITNPIAPNQTSKNSQDVILNNFAISFFTSPVFKLESYILSFAGMRGPSRREIEGQVEPSSNLKPAFVIENKTDSEIIFKSAEHIRTWLQVSESNGIMYFRLGSAVDYSKGDTKALLTWILTPFHQVYSRVLLYSAVQNYRRLNEEKK